MAWLDDVKTAFKALFSPVAPYASKDAAAEQWATTLGDQAVCRLGVDGDATKLTGAVDLKASTGITLTRVAQTIEVAASGGGGGGGGISFYLDDSSSDVATFYQLLSLPNTGIAEQTDSVVVKAADGDKLIEQYLSEPGHPGVTVIPAGEWQFHFWAYVDNATGVSKLRLRVYKRSAGGVKTELFNVYTDEINALAVTEYTVSSVQPDHLLDATDRIVLEVYGLTTSVPNRTISFTHNGTAHYSHFHAPGVEVDQRIGQQTLTLLSGYEQFPSDSGVWAVGQFYFDPALIPAGFSLRLAADARVSDAAETGTVTLWDMVDDEAVSDVLSFTGSADFQHLTDALVVSAAAGDVKNTARLYELRIEMGGGGTRGIYMQVSSVRLEIHR